MFSPLGFYIKKKSSDEDFNHQESNELWTTLKDNKKLKFIRKAEKAYDQYRQENPDDENIKPLSDSLKLPELRLLLESYGMPKKLPANVRLFYFEKLQNINGLKLEDDTDMETSSTHDNYKELSDKWTQLSDQEKSELLKEYQAAESEYNREFFKFARNLPEARIVDYEYYLANPEKRVKHKKSNMLRDSSSHGISSSPVKQKKQPDENKLNEFHPHHIYYERMKSEFSKFGSEFMAKQKARSAYSALPSNKKLKFIKEAESIYDSYEFKSNPKPILAHYLSKIELYILLKDYEMPDKVSNQLAQFIKEHSHEFKDCEPGDRFRLAMEKYKQLSDEEKSEYAAYHSKLVKDFSEKEKKFKKTLPSNRLEDYEYYKKGKKTYEKQKQSSKK